jgi:hypothetical protein
MTSFPASSAKTHRACSVQEARVCDGLPSYLLLLPLTSTPRPKLIMPPKISSPPPSAFSEPSEPSDLKPEDKPKDQITKPQEENPQVIVTKNKEQAKEKKADKPRPKL